MSNKKYTITTEWNKQKGLKAELKLNYFELVWEKNLIYVVKVSEMYRADQKFLDLCWERVQMVMNEAHIPARAICLFDLVALTCSQ